MKKLFPILFISLFIFSCQDDSPKYKKYEVDIVFRDLNIESLVELQYSDETVKYDILITNHRDYIPKSGSYGGYYSYPPLGKNVNFSSFYLQLYGNNGKFKNIELNRDRNEEYDDKFKVYLIGSFNLSRKDFNNINSVKIKMRNPGGYYN
tara:strand:+ start:258 stop:707 length:450 start_codon:yes stop_codon:yes gene_type:complete